MFGFNNQIVQEDLERIYLSNISWDIFNGKTVLVTGAKCYAWHLYCLFLSVFGKSTSNLTSAHQCSICGSPSICIRVITSIYTTTKQHIPLDEM